MTEITHKKYVDYLLQNLDTIYNLSSDYEYIKEFLENLYGYELCVNSHGYFAVYGTDKIHTYPNFMQDLVNYLGKYANNYLLGSEILEIVAKERG